MLIVIYIPLHVSVLAVIISVILQIIVCDDIWGYFFMSKTYSI